MATSSWSCSSSNSIASNSKLVDYSSDEDEGPPDVQILLKSMGFALADIHEAIESCGADSIEKLVSFISAKHSGSADEDIARLLDMGFPIADVYEAATSCGSGSSLETMIAFLVQKDSVDMAAIETDEEQQPTKRPRLSGRHLKGFGLPGEPPVPRTLTPEQAMRPFFYFENVRSMPSGEWITISKFLYGIEPEFVCARFFSVSRRPRGFVHNLPLENRQVALPLPPKTIREFLPASEQYRPAWDDREQLHCINTCASAASICRKVHNLIAEGNVDKQAEILQLVKKWNLVWTGPGVCSALEPHEVERALGFEENHTRGGISISERHKSLGNAFQVDVVAYHLSVLKPLFPDGIRVLSLFSGIGGAEVALQRAGIRLNFVASVELKEENRNILRRWWIRSGQTGTHVMLSNVEELTESKLIELVRQAGGMFHLVIGGSPCNNFSGNNRATRSGLEGMCMVAYAYHSRSTLSFVGEIELDRDARL